MFFVPVFFEPGGCYFTCCDPCVRYVLKSRKFGQSTTRARPSRSPKPRNAKLGQPFAVRPAGGSWLGAIQAPSRFTDTRDGRRAYTALYTIQPLQHPSGRHVSTSAGQSAFKYPRHVKKSVALLTYVVVDYPGGGGANAAKTCYEKVRKHTDRNPYARQGLCGGAWAAMEPLESRPRSRSARASALWASLPLLVRPLRIGIAIHCAMCHTCDVGPARAAGGKKMALGAYRGYICLHRT